MFLKIGESAKNRTQSLQDEVERFPQTAKSSCRRYEGHFSNLANICEQMRIEANDIISNAFRIALSVIVGFLHASEHRFGELIIFLSLSGDVSPEMSHVDSEFTDK
jgi:hypothetical protein